MSDMTGSAFLNIYAKLYFITVIRQAAKTLKNVFLITVLTTLVLHVVFTVHFVYIRL